MAGLVKFFIKIVFALLISKTVNAFEVYDCSDSDAIAKLGKVSIASCPIGTSAQYCPLVRGQQVSIDIDFETRRYHPSLIAEFHHYIG